MMHNKWLELEKKKQMAVQHTYAMLPPHQNEMLGVFYRLNLLQKYQSWPQVSI